MVRTPVTLNDPEGHLSHVTLFNLLFGKYDTYLFILFVISICVLQLGSIHVTYDLE